MAGILDILKQGARNVQQKNETRAEQRRVSDANQQKYRAEFDAFKKQAAGIVNQLNNYPDEADRLYNVYPKLNEWLKQLGYYHGTDNKWRKDITEGVGEATTATQDAVDTEALAQSTDDSDTDTAAPNFKDTFNERTLQAYKNKALKLVQEFKDGTPSYGKYANDLMPDAARINEIKAQFHNYCAAAIRMMQTDEQAVDFYDKLVAAGVTFERPVTSLQDFKNILIDDQNRYVDRAFDNSTLSVEESERLKDLYNADIKSVINTIKGLNISNIDVFYSIQRMLMDKTRMSGGTLDYNKDGYVIVKSDPQRLGLAAAFDALNKKRAEWTALGNSTEQKYNSAYMRAYGQQNALSNNIQWDGAKIAEEQIAMRYRLYTLENNLRVMLYRNFHKVPDNSNELIGIPGLKDGVDKILTEMKGIQQALNSLQLQTREQREKNPEFRAAFDKSFINNWINSFGKVLPASEVQSLRAQLGISDSSANEPVLQRLTRRM